MTSAPESAAPNPPASQAPQAASAAPPSRRWVWLLLLALLALFALDRLSILLVPPQYRTLPDRARYQDLYYSSKFAQFRQVRDNLDLVFLGDSRTRHGVDPSVFAGQQGLSSPTAFNFAPASSGIEFTDVMLRNYLISLPKLKTVVWGTSPRIFNRYWQDPVYAYFTASDGYRHDQLTAKVGWTRMGMAAATRLAFDAAMTTLSQTYSHREVLKGVIVDWITPAGHGRGFAIEPPMPMSAWGFMALPQAQVVDASDPAARARYVESVRNGRFALDPKRWEEFVGIIELLRARGIQLVCFTPPMDGATREAGAADADGTPLADYDGLMAKLHALEQQCPNFRFLDLQDGGRNDFAAADFGDFEHLTAAGAVKLSHRLDEALTTGRVVAATPPQPAAVPVPAPAAPAATAPAAASPASGDTTAPTVRSLLGDEDYAIRAFPPDNRPELWAEYSDAQSGIDPASIRFYVNDADVTAQCTVTPARVSYRPAAALETPKLYRFRVVVKDRAGNQAELAWEILVKPC